LALKGWRKLKRKQSICLLQQQRKGEILALQKSQVNFETRSVIPKHFTRKKRSGITFFNAETAFWLQTRALSQEKKGRFSEIVCC